MFVNLDKIPDWLSAFGTIGATIVALYLAKQDSRISLSIEASQGDLVSEGGSPNDGKYVWVTVTNIGRRKARIEAIFWRAGIFKRKNYFWKTPRNQISSVLPAFISDGEGVSFFIKADEFKGRFANIIRNSFKGYTRFLKSQFVFVIVRTSTGETFKKRIKKSLKEFLLEHQDIHLPNV